MLVSTRLMATCQTISQDMVLSMPDGDVSTFEDLHWSELCLCAQPCSRGCRDAEESLCVQIDAVRSSQEYAACARGRVAISR